MRTSVSPGSLADDGLVTGRCSGKGWRDDKPGPDWRRPDPRARGRVAKLRLGEVLGTTAQLASVIAVAAACDVVRADTGLIAAIVMGLAVANQPGFDLPARRPFFETGPAG
jgi:hypothetical protein